MCWSSGWAPGSALGAQKGRNGTVALATGLCGSNVVITEASAASTYWEEGDTPRVGEVFYVGGTVQNLSVCSITKTLPVVVWPTGALPAVDAEHPAICEMRVQGGGERTVLTRPCATVAPGVLPRGVQITAVDAADPATGAWTVLPNQELWVWIPFVATDAMAGATPPTVGSCAQTPPHPTCAGAFGWSTFVTSSAAPSGQTLDSYIGVPIPAGKRTGPPPKADEEFGIPSIQRIPAAREITAARSIRLRDLRAGSLVTTIALPPGANAQVTLLRSAQSDLPKQLARGSARGAAGFTPSTAPTRVRLRLTKPASRALAKRLLRGRVPLRLVVSVRTPDGRRASITKPITIRR